MWSAACLGDGHLALGVVAMEMVIEELRAVVGVKALQAKWQALLNVRKLRTHAISTLVPNGAVLRPAAENVGKR